MYIYMNAMYTNVYSHKHASTHTLLVSSLQDMRPPL